MSLTLSLGQKYGSFFWGCTKFAISPYTNTFLSIVKSKEVEETDCLSKALAASIVCGILTFVVPVLPVLCAFTFTLSSIAMLLAVASMFVTYPIAILGDALCGPELSDDYHYSF
ncbi:hypothetical protein [Legionella pneumophila]|uniref:hypothetical protein n=1 Tax=Legionella pneumophila TaxID=446 RepID=UPI001A278AEF|nr:hypothetical protein [Legionella pneumophila]HAT9398437.1 hypothetical protein [Legionella pneumophila subsp. pneumophila]MCW8403390.1 hypothetical protein [Legionella pneumophila]MCZ4698908.1 hypothetical protein [Legionella pneumophila]MCZ4714447.1 hypothetical protein [Legionella pneumophila]MCZ4744641.1 hypothetical protein [Legionella pneumophila]